MTTAIFDTPPIHCPCGSKLPYQDCCERLHLDPTCAKSAEALMRSRYTAFVMHDIDYVVSTTAPFQQALLDRASLLNWAQQTAWAGLTVIRHIPKSGKRHAQVEFNALFTSAVGVEAHHELSSFVKIGKTNPPRWYFLDPTVKMSVTQKQPCPCGSGEIYKHCCGLYL